MLVLAGALVMMLAPSAAPPVQHRRTAAMQPELIT
jgi:hypothetical protein